MSSLVKAFKPVNRHLSIIPHFKESKAEKSGVLLPEDFTQQSDEHLLATVLGISSDCSSSFQKLRNSGLTHQVIVDASMIKKIEMKGKSYYLVLENYVLGILGGSDAH